MAHHTTTIKSAGSIALGGLFAGGTLYSLLSDIQSHSQITPDHVMTVLVVIGNHRFRPFDLAGVPGLEAPACPRAGSPLQRRHVLGGHQFGLAERRGFGQESLGSPEPQRAPA
jgi:hypothetical protein